MRIVDDTGKELRGSARSYFVRCMNDAKWKFKFVLLKNGEEDILVVWSSGMTHPDVRKMYRSSNRNWVHADSGYLQGWIADYNLPPSSRKGHPAVAETPELLANRDRLIPLLHEALVSPEQEEQRAG